MEICDSSKERTTSLSDERKKAKVVELKTKIKDDDLVGKFPHMNDIYLERFLGGTSFNVEEAFKRLKTYYELLIEFPEWFTTNPPMKSKHIIEQNIRVVLPGQTDKEGRPIYVVKLGNCNPSKMELLEVVTVDDIWIESILLQYPAERGLCVIIDIANFYWKSIKWLTPHNMKVAVKKVQSLPFKDFQFHIVKNHIMVHAAIKIIWPFIPEYLKKMVKFHFSDWESLHNHINPEILPGEYGGFGDDIDYIAIYNDLYKQNEKILMSFQLSRKL